MRSSYGSLQTANNLYIVAHFMNLLTFVGLPYGHLYTGGAWSHEGLLPSVDGDGGATVTKAIANRWWHCSPASVAHSH